MKAALETWRILARPGQIAPPPPWRTWVMLGGRGAGKTRAGAEWVREEVRRGRAGRIALAGPSLHDVREVMIEGHSGLRHLPGARPSYETTRRRLVWPNGAQAHVISAQEPDNFRGPQFDAVWADELCLWPDAEETLATLRLALRIGEEPRLVVTTTPRPMPALVNLLTEDDVVAWRVSTASNRANLAEGFVEAAKARWGGANYGRQELEGELLDAPEGALWSRTQIEACVVETWPALDRTVVAVDPPASVGPRADACGIVVAGAYGEAPRRAVILADASVRGLSPAGWATHVAAQARTHRAMIVAEANNGGEMVREILRSAAPEMIVALVHARQGKRDRAMPVAAYYEAGRVSHGGRFHALEDEMCTFGAQDHSRSPDRLDALVWAVHVLLDERGMPRITRF
jgi:phage terminase large subunit-like protein